MNIFATSPDPVICAAVLDDKRVVKMILESAQLLSTVLGGPYRPTHLNHPCTIWVQESPAHQVWLYHHFIALLDEYTRRFQKIHSCARLADVFASRIDVDAHQTESVTPVNCTTDYREEPNTYVAYQQQLLKKWREDKREPRWYRLPINSANERIERCLLHIGPSFLSRECYPILRSSLPVSRGDE